MTVPEGAPKHIEWADRMAQALAVLGANAGTTEIRYRKRYDNYKDMEKLFLSTRRALSNLDKVREEIMNSDLEKVVCYLAEASPDICDTRNFDMFNVEEEEVLAARELIKLWSEGTNGG